MFHVSGVLFTEMGVLLAILIGAERDIESVPREEFEQRKADALSRLVQRLAAGDTEGSATVLTHHINEWVRDDGETVPANLVLFCARHHGAIHNRGWTITGNPETGDIEFRNPNGRTYLAVIQQNLTSGIEPGPDTIIPAGRGERYDHELTIWAIANRPRPDSAEPPPNPS